MGAFLLKKPLLPLNVNKRFQFEKVHVNWTKEEGLRILFLTDKTKFEQFGSKWRL